MQLPRWNAKIIKKFAKIYEFLADAKIYEFLADWW